MHVTEHEIIEGTPYINGKKAIRCTSDKCSCKDHMKDVFVPWKCPECKSHLSSKTMVCLNACHLNAESATRLSEMMAKVLKQGWK